MPKRVLAIGVGGSGKEALTILKERLEETYGQVPDNVVLLSLDTDDLREGDTFAGTRLNPGFDERKREPEFQQVVSKPGVTMGTVFADIASGRTTAYMSWLEHEKLSRILGPAGLDIRGGAQQRRPVGRVALFQRWDNPISSSIREAITRMYGEPDEERPVDEIKREQSKRLIFIIGSVAGGTGSGFLIDIANLVRHIVQSNTKWQSVDVSAIIVLPDAFSTYAPLMDDPTNLKPNSYAALRELDRFIRTHNIALPYMIRYGDDVRSITWSTNQPVDHVYLVDTTSPSAIGDFDLTGDPKRGVFPVIADFVMAHVDQSLGDALATLRSNAGMHYDKEEGWQYSSFNVLTYIFPVDDVIESFSYRFLRELLARQFLPISDKTRHAEVEQAALKAVDQIFSENDVKGKVNPGIIQKAIAATRRINPETPDVSWTGLFNMIALSESGFAEDYKDLNQWLTYLADNLVPTKDKEYKHETFDEGYTRLRNFSEQYLDDCLGPRTDPENEEARANGQWDKILGRYRDALRQRFAEALDAALLDVLNSRDPNSKVLMPSRLPLARTMVAALKSKLVHFKELVQEEYRKLDLDTRIRQVSEGLRTDIAWMQDTKDSKTFALLGKPEARKAQESYIGHFREKMELILHQRIFDIVIDVLDALGAAEKDSSGNYSVIDEAALELENWQATFQEVDRILVQQTRTHEKNRANKRAVKVRRYLTDPAFEEQLYKRPEHSGWVGGRVLGQVRGEVGMIWKRLEETQPLDYKLTTTWAKEATGAEAIAREFFLGAKNLFQVVREHVTVANRIQESFTSPTSFVNVVNQVNEPFLRYNPAANVKSMFHERYVSYNTNKAADAARVFMEEAHGTLRNQGVNVDTAAESLVACTVIDVARGARLSAVDQFTACNTDYRFKLYKGKESLHLFPEEQVATDYEGRIESLGEPENKLRPLAPELVIVMGDEAKLRIFTLACAYGLIEPGTFWDAENRESTEIFLTLKKNGVERRLPLSQSQWVQQNDPRFNTQPAEEKIARLYLNALQNFVLKVTEKPGVPSQMVAELVSQLQKQGVNLQHIQNPFTLSLKEVGDTIREKIESLGPSEQVEPDRARRDALNAQLRVEKYLQPFLLNMVLTRDQAEVYLKSPAVSRTLSLEQQNKPRYGFKSSPVARVRDMGTVMHLILQNEISELLRRSQAV